ncbi:hypothetical protein ES707_11589 [subsurface metagenome]
MVAQGDAVLRQRDRSELDVEAELEDPGGFQQRLQRGQRLGRLDLVRRQPCVEQPGAATGLLVAERHVCGIVRRDRQREAGNLRLHRIDRIRHRIDDEMPGVRGAREPRLERIEVAQRRVLLAVDRNLLDSVRAGFGERDRRALWACGLVLPIGGFLGRGKRRVAGEQVAGCARGFCLGLAQRGAYVAIAFGISRNIGRIDVRIFGDAAREGGELHRLEEGDQLARIRLVDRKLVERHVEIDLVVEQHELARDAGLLGIFEQRLAPLRLFDLAGAEQQLFQIAILDNQLRRGLDADAGHTRHVVGGIAGQRLHFHHLLRRHAELFDHLRDADATVLHGVEHHDLVGHQLHQILVRGHDGRGGAALGREPGIGRNQVVRLEANLFQAGQIEGAHGVADQSELRDQIVGRGRAVRLVVGIELVAERDLGLVEDDGQMRRPVVGRHVAEQLPQHVAEAEHGIDLQAVRLAVQRRQRVVGAENIGGAVHQEQMVALGDCLSGDRLCVGLGIGLGGGFFGGFGGCLRHGRNLSLFARNDSLRARVVTGFFACSPVGLSMGCFARCSVSPWAAVHRKEET